MITAEQFARTVGSAPVDDDLERANCPSADETGHAQCGWNDVLSLPNYVHPGPAVESIPAASTPQEGTDMPAFQRGDRVKVKGWGDLAFIVQSAVDPRDDRVEVASPDGSITGREFPHDLTLIEGN